MRGVVPFVYAGAQFGQAIGHRRQLQVGSADGIAQIEQHFGDAAHADSSDPGEVKMLNTKKHFINVLFRLPQNLSIYFSNP